MTAINGRVARLERAYGLHQVPGDEDAAMLRRFEGFLKSLPTPLLRSLVTIGRAIDAREPLTAEQQAMLEEVEFLWAAGAWLT